MREIVALASAKSFLNSLYNVNVSGVNNNYIANNNKKSPLTFCEKLVNYITGTALRTL